MELQEITISLPASIYRLVQKQSQVMQRSIAEEVVAVVSAALPDQELLSAELEKELSELSLFSDEELWRAARISAPETKNVRIQELVDKQQLEGLTEGEKAEAALLSDFFNRIMLVRARAAVLLKERGYNIENLRSPENA